MCNSMYYKSMRYTGIIWLPIRRNTNRDIECMSKNGKDCGWQKLEVNCVHPHPLVPLWPDDPNNGHIWSLCQKLF